MSRGKVRVGYEYTVAARNASTKKPVRVYLRIVETGWYASTTKPHLEFQGAVARFENGGEILFFNTRRIRPTLSKQRRRRST